MNESILKLYHSYFADIALPFAFYFLLTISETRHAFLKPWWIKALSVFALCTTSEILQYFGIFALARTFDPLDIVMYGLEVLLAVAVERGIFAPQLAFWD
ncbi:MAG: hypothetical protein K8S97_08350 [Anaerolineae bacterium]|nr:hypothetical protein [Anaerolineae bacterium]